MEWGRRDLEMAGMAEGETGLRSGAGITELPLSGETVLLQAGP